MGPKSRIAVCWVGLLLSVPVRSMAQEPAEPEEPVSRGAAPERSAVGAGEGARAGAGEGARAGAGEGARAGAGEGARAGEVERAGEGGRPRGRSRVRAPVIDVLPAATLARVAGLDLPSGATEAAERAARRVDRGLRAELRADAIRSGRADGYHHALGRSLRAAVRIDVRGPVADAFESSSLPVVIAEDMMRPTARARPIEPRGTPLPETADGHNDMDTSPVGEIAEQQNLLNAPASWRRAVIRIHQDRSGAIALVTLVSSSGRRSIDEAALEAGRRARAGGRPPARVVGDRSEITSDWAIEIGDVASSPGVLGCTDDGECAALGRGITRIRVELLDVSDAMLGEATEE